MSISAALVPVSTPLHPFAPEDFVNWAQLPVASAPKVPALVRKVGGKQIQIEIRVREAHSTSTHPTAQLKWVDPATLSPRQFPSALFSEPMLMQLRGFTLTGRRHATGTHPSFKDGIWYGAVNGLTCTAPYSSEEAALQAAHGSLVGGGYRAMLLTGIDTSEKVIANGQDIEGRTCAQLLDYQTRLAQLDQAVVSLAEGDDQ